MRQNGFSFVELVTVIAIAGILMAIATLYFNQMTVKSGIEGEVKALYADLVAVRSQSLYQKRGRSVKLSAASFAIYSSNDVGVTPITTKPLRYPVTFSSAQIDFDTSGVITTGQNAICVQQTNAAASDSIAVDTMQLQMGKRTGTGYTYGDISLK